MNPDEPQVPPDPSGPDPTVPPPLPGDELQDSGPTWNEDPQGSESSPTAEAGGPWYGEQGGGGQGDYSTTGGPSWEYRAELGIVKAAYRTVVECLFHPGETFAVARRSGGIGEPMLYSLIVGSILIFATFLMGSVVSLMFQGVIGSFSPSGSINPLQVMGMTGFAMIIQLVVMLFFAPAAAVLGPLISALIAHVCLMIVKGTRYDFEATYRVVAYCGTSAQVLGLIPFCGAYIAGLWSIVIEIIGLAQMHKIETWRAVVAVLMPIALIFCCVFGVVFAIFGIGIMAVRSTGTP